MSRYAIVSSRWLDSARLSVFTLLTVALLIATPASYAATPLNAVLTADAGADGNDARVRVVHASPDAPAVDVWVEGTRVLENVPFEAVSDYLSVPPGDYRVQVEPAGSNGAGPFVIDAVLTLAGATDYTVIASDVLANITPLVLVDDNSRPAAGEAKVRFVHASPDAPAVDIALTGGPVLFGDVPFQAAGDYLSVPAGVYNLEVRVAGTDVVVLTLPGVRLERNRVYTAFATGLVAQGAADRTLYLADDRFRLEVDWTDFGGQNGFGRQVPLFEDSGYFWFFGPNNVELTVKVLDGRAVNGAFWVFFGSLSDVAFTLRVTDTETNQTRTYSNPAGTFASVGDTNAFPGN